MNTTRQRGFTLTELMIAAVIVGLLTALALPFYQHRVRKANMVELINIGDHLAEKVIAFYVIQGRWPDKTNDMEAAIGTADDTAFANGDWIETVFVDDRDGAGQVYFRVSGDAIDDSQPAWLRLQLTDTNPMIAREWCSTGGSFPTPAEAYEYLPC